MAQRRGSFLYKKRVFCHLVIRIDIPYSRRKKLGNWQKEMWSAWPVGKNSLAKNSWQKTLVGKKFGHLAEIWLLFSD